MALCLVFNLFAGCSSQQLDTAGNDEVTPAGFVEKTDKGLLLQPAPLYGSPRLSLGAIHAEGDSPLLLLCDEQRRPVDKSKPLVLYMDGDYRSLPWTASKHLHVSGCAAFATDMKTLDKLASVERAMLRVYFTEETVEHRISGTTADYFSRPKMFGPQRSIGRFVEAVQETFMSGGIANGSLPTANND